MGQMGLKVMPEFWQKIFKAVEESVELPKGANKETICYTHELIPGEHYPSLVTTIKVDVYGNKMAVRATLKLDSLEIIKDE